MHQQILLDLQSINFSCWNLKQTIPFCNWNLKKILLITPAWLGSTVITHYRITDCTNPQYCADKLLVLPEWVLLLFTQNNQTLSSNPFILLMLKWCKCEATIWNSHATQNKRAQTFNRHHNFKSHFRANLSHSTRTVVAYFVVNLKITKARVNMHHATCSVVFSWFSAEINTNLAWLLLQYH